MKKTVKVVMLSTEKADIIHLNLHLNKLSIFNKPYPNGDNTKSQHLYLTSDEEIKEGDWVIENSNIIVKVVSLFEDNCLVKNNTAYNTNLKLCKKIVATTDNSINVNYPIAEIPESFIQAYIKAYNEGNTITEVTVEYEQIKKREITSIGTMSISNTFITKTRSDNTVIVHQAKMYQAKMYTRDEVEKLLGKILADSNNPKYTVQDRGDRFTMDQIFPLNKWIQDNL